MITVKPGKTVEAAIDKNGQLRRVLKINAMGNGRVTVSEVSDDSTFITVMSTVGHATVELDATQLRQLAVGIAELFGDTILCSDEQYDREKKLRDKIFDVLVDNESRCLDDNIDRDVVLARLMEALT